MWDITNHKRGKASTMEYHRNLGNELKLIGIGNGFECVCKWRLGTRKAIKTSNKNQIYSKKQINNDK